MVLAFEEAGRRRSESRAGSFQSILSLTYAWSAFAIMWVFWISFVIFLAQPQHLLHYWPLPTVDQGGALLHPVTAACVDLLLIALFGLQHSLMARPWFKAWWAASVPPAFERSTYVHIANLALFALIIFWQPIPAELWNVHHRFWHDALWAVFIFGWIILLLGAHSFGILDLLGIEQMRCWSNGERPRPPRLKTGLLYRWLRHPMYVGVLLGVWVTPAMSVGRALLAADVLRATCNAV
jgi:methanethiol S-methyltransferase